MKKNIFIFSFILISGLLFAQNKKEVMQTTRKIADKIINETVFDYQLVPLKYHGSVSQFSMDLPSQDYHSVYYFLSRMISEKETDGILGFSYQGNIKVFLNGNEVFNGNSAESFLQEYTYNRYQFQKKIPVKWRRGENEILIKAMPKKGRIQAIMMPIDKMDMKAGFIVIIPVINEPENNWISCGPWNLKEGDAISTEFSPEKEFREYYRENGNIKAWKAVSGPVLRELVIPETNSFLRDSYADWHYANGGTMLGILSLYQLSDDDKYLQFVKEYTNNILENYEYFEWQYNQWKAMRGSYHKIFRKTMLDDTGGPALPFVQLQTMGQGSDDFLFILDDVFDYVMNGQQRLKDGTFCRPEPEVNTIWADDLFMSVPFLLRMAKLTGRKELYDEIAKQILNFNEYLCNNRTGLYFHGWYDERKENTAVQWSRANGWVIWATSEALLHLPEKHTEYKTILKIFRKHMEALVKFQDESGMWHQVLDHPETFEETSSTAMFTLGLARGVRMGWLKKKYEENVYLAWKALERKIEKNGTVKDICRGTEIGEDVEFYANRKRFDHDPRGLGAILTAGCEVYKLLKD